MTRIRVHLSGRVAGRAMIEWKEGKGKKEEAKERDDHAHFRPDRTTPSTIATTIKIRTSATMRRIQMIFLRVAF